MSSRFGLAVHYARDYSATNYSCNCSDATYMFRAQIDNKKGPPRGGLFATSFYLLDHQDLPRFQVIGLKLVFLLQLGNGRIIGIRNAREGLARSYFVPHRLTAYRL